MNNKSDMEKPRVVIDMEVTLKDGTKYIVEDFQAIYFFDDIINVIGEYTYEFGKDEILFIDTQDTRVF